MRRQFIVYLQTQSPTLERALACPAKRTSSVVGMWRVETACSSVADAQVRVSRAVSSRRSIGAPLQRARLWARVSTSAACVPAKAFPGLLCLRRKRFTDNGTSDGIRCCARSTLHLKRLLTSNQCLRRSRVSSRRAGRKVSFIDISILAAVSASDRQRCWFSLPCSSCKRGSGSLPSVAALAHSCFHAAIVAHAMLLSIAICIICYRQPRSARIRCRLMLPVQLEEQNIECH